MKLLLLETLIRSTSRTLNLIILDLEERRKFRQLTDYGTQLLPIRLILLQYLSHPRIQIRIHLCFEIYCGQEFRERMIMLVFPRP